MFGLQVFWVFCCFPVRIPDCEWLPTQSEVAPFPSAELSGNVRIDTCAVRTRTPTMAHHGKLVHSGSLVVGRVLSGAEARVPRFLKCVGPKQNLCCAI